MTAAVDTVVDELVARIRRPGRGGAVDNVPVEIERHLDHLAPLLPPVQRESIRRAAVAALCGLGPLETLLADPDVTEVTVNGSTEVWVERAGQLERAGRLVPGEIDTLVERAIAPLGLRFDLANPVVDARLANGSRLCAVRQPLAVDGTCLSIRRFALLDVTLDAFASSAVAELLVALVRGRANVVVSGATSAGKTTMLNALAGVCRAGERIITIEDAAELDLRTPHVVRLEARRATPDGLGEVTVRDLVRTALRLRPDRLVVGEVRGPEAYDMVQALNTGHDGSLSTVHANGPADALRRLTALVLSGAPALGVAAVSEQVHASIDAIVHVGRGAGGRRQVLEVAEVAEPGHLGHPLVTLAGPAGVLRRPARLRLTGSASPP